MKKRVLVFFSALFISGLLVTNAQTSLAGRSYHHPNIMADAMKDATKDLAIKKGMKTAITIEFIDDKKIVLKPDIKINDDALKAAGMGWLKRKALKAALALAPKSEKGTYIVKGDMIIMTDSNNEKDTMTISKDGKFLYGKFDEKTPFKLTRTK